MLTEADIERIMDTQKQLTESLAESCINTGTLDFISDEDLYMLPDYTMPGPKTNDSTEECILKP